MLVYRYDPETKIFLYSEPAMLDPLETQKAGKNIYLLPANCTFTKPPQEREGYNVVYDTKAAAWRYEEHKRTANRAESEIFQAINENTWKTSKKWDRNTRS